MLFSLFIGNSNGIFHVYHVHESFDINRSARRARLEFIPISLLLNSLLNSLNYGRCRKRILDRRRRVECKRQRWDYNKLYRTETSSTKSGKKKAAPLHDTFIHLLKDLLSCEALHRIKRTVLGIGTIFPFLLRHSAFGQRERKDPRDMLRSLHWDEQSLFNLMFVRTSIISFVQERESLKGCLGQVETRKCFIYISEKSGNSFVLIVKLVNVTELQSRSQNFLFVFCFFHFLATQMKNV